ncbi:hypothetical protein DL89DRAFT_293754 [Linderina pennispora]|uniref:Uncharacterized protein n=1 Tax=Linderina pennispora TaxID=61395 RepID=A0A1Y1W4S1_9FUNG|nr:uncharacterized protein DL89DRAFT_293754 [Linderina pennispora]ORX68507.1 hypothetical protein DL89DRAFT_293754 [Linderina pennispora]
MSNTPNANNAADNQQQSTCGCNGRSAAHGKGSHVGNDNGKSKHKGDSEDDDDDDDDDEDDCIIC